MSMLVGMAMVALPECSPQGISNIAWALSKIGGDLLYQSEMDRIADVAITKVQEFNAQNVANVAGAFPSMRQSAPGLFSALAQRAAQILQTFKEQELAQFLWDNDARFQCHVSDVTSSMHQEMDRPLNFSRDQIGNIAWSYAVIGKMDRPFFLHIWRTLSQFEEQREVGRLLYSTGHEWVREYAIDGYTVDAVLVDEKLAFEIDGSTHFSRNLGTPLGHTAFKRCYITPSGWKLVSLSLQEWDELQGEFEQLEYLRRILDIEAE
uniref:RAP domain-containing protein n=1 Tax=Setaria italica TaxID=4555 RepID=K4A2M1_SETIT